MADNRLKYGLLKGTVKGEPTSQSAQPHGGGAQDIHYHLHASISTGAQGSWDMAVNVGTNSSDDLLRYLFVDPFNHPILSQLDSLKPGFTQLDQTQQLPALDFCRSDIIPGGLQALGVNTVIQGNPEATQPYSQLTSLLEAAAKANALVYVFGHPYTTGQGIHDIHMNQGSTGHYTARNGHEHNDVWEDGAIFIQFSDRWVALFTAFSGQQTPTDDETGNPL